MFDSHILTSIQRRTVAETVRLSGVRIISCFNHLIQFYTIEDYKPDVHRSLWVSGSVFKGNVIALLRSAIALRAIQ